MDNAELAGESPNGPFSASERNTGNHLTPTLIRRYVDGELSAAQMHAVERHCLYCQLCSDTLEGFASRSANGRLTGDFLGKDLVELNKRLEHRIQGDRRKKLRPLLFQPWSIAATFLVLFTAALVVLTNRVRRAPVEEPQAEVMIPMPSSTDTLIIYQKPAFVMVRHAAGHGSQTPPSLQSADSRPAAEMAMRRDLLGPRSNKPSVPLAAAPQEANAERALSGRMNGLVIKESKVADTLYKSERQARIGNPTSAFQADKNMDGPLPDVTISGRIHEEGDLTALPGVNVMVKGTSQSTITDRDGQFTLTAPVGSTLVFNFVGMETKEVKVTDQPNLDVALRPDVKALSEVVVIGYGTKKNADGSPMPSPEGGFKVLHEYLSQHLRYPEQARQMQVKGTVGLEFTVEPDGSLSNFRVSKSLGYGCDEEAVRALMEGPKWKPGVENNQPVRKKVKTKIKFGK